MSSHFLPSSSPPHPALILLVVTLLHVSWLAPLALAKPLQPEPELTPADTAIETYLDRLGLKTIGVIPESPGVLTASNAGIPVILDEASDAGQAYADAVARLCGEERPMRFIDAQKKGLLARIFGS